MFYMGRSAELSGGVAALGVVELFSATARLGPCGLVLWNEFKTTAAESGCWPRFIDAVFRFLVRRYSVMARYFLFVVGLLFCCLKYRSSSSSWSG